MSNVIISPAGMARAREVLAVYDLRLCIAHKKPINRCIHCYPMFLAHLGRLSLTDAIVQRGRSWQPRNSLFRSTRKEQTVFALELGLLRHV